MSFFCHLDFDIDLTLSYGIASSSRTLETSLNDKNFMTLHFQLYNFPNPRFYSF